MRASLRLLGAVLLAVVGLCMTLIAAPGDRKIEQLRESAELTKDTPRDKLKTDCPCRLLALHCVLGRTYTIDLRSDDFDSYLRLEDPSGKTVAEDDDSGGGPSGHDARIVFKAEAAGSYTIVCTSYSPSARGKYTLIIAHDGFGKDEVVKPILDEKGKLTKEDARDRDVGSSRVDLQACKLEYSIVSPK